MPDMKIACMDNMNHFMFVLTRYLNGLGVETDLLMVGSEKPFFQPASDTVDPQRWEPRVKRLGWGGMHRFFLTSPRRVRDGVAPYDILFGMGFVPAYLARAGLRLDVFVTYAGDVIEGAFPTHEPGYRYSRLRYLGKRLVAPYQQRGIRESRRALLGQPTPTVRNAYGRLGVEPIPLPLPYLYMPDFDQPPPPDALPREAAERFAQLRRDHEVLILNHSRQAWKTPECQGEGAKDNHLLFQGFAAHLKQSPSRKTALVCFEYGVDVATSKELVRNLGIEENVHWLPLIPRVGLKQLLRQADLVADQFGLGWMGAAGWEAVAAGAPLLINFDCDMFSRAYGMVAPPLMLARDPRGIAELLGAFDADPAPFREQGKAGREWFITNMGEGLARRYLALAEEVLKEKRGT